MPTGFLRLAAISWSSRCPENALGRQIEWNGSFLQSFALANANGSGTITKGQVFCLERSHISQTHPGLQQELAQSDIPARGAMSGMRRRPQQGEHLVWLEPDGLSLTSAAHKAQRGGGILGDDSVALELGEERSEALNPTIYRSGAEGLFLNQVLAKRGQVYRLNTVDGHGRLAIEVLEPSLKKTQVMAIAADRGGGNGALRQMLFEGREQSVVENHGFGFVYTHNSRGLRPFALCV